MPIETISSSNSANAIQSYSNPDVQQQNNRPQSSQEANVQPTQRDTVQISQQARQLASQPVDEPDSVVRGQSAAEETSEPRSQNTAAIAAYQKTAQA